MLRIFKSISLFLLSVIHTIVQQLYKLPSHEVIDTVDASSTPGDIVNPQGKYVLPAGYEAMPSMAYMSRPVLRPASKRILPGNKSTPTTTFYTGLFLIDLVYTGGNV